MADGRTRRAAGKTVDPRLIPLFIDLRLRYFEKLKDAGGCRQTATMWDKLKRTNADSLYRSASLHASMGAAFGPLAATAFVEGENASAVLLFGIAMTMLSLALFGLFLISVRHRVKRQPLPVRVFRRSPSAAAPRMPLQMALAGLAGSCRQRLDFGVEQMGASNGRHRAALLVSRPNFAQRRGTGC